LKDSVRLLFWSGQSFATPGLARPKASSRLLKRVTASRTDRRDVLTRWLAESRDIQWDYQNLVRKRRLDPLF
jgi:hypothetical protein